jgi:spatacsin
VQTDRLILVTFVDDFSSLARLVTGVISTLSFILDIVIENGQLELLLENYSAAAETATGSVAAVRGFRMTVFTSLKRYNPHGLMALMILQFFMHMSPSCCSFLYFSFDLYKCRKLVGFTLS